MNFWEPETWSFVLLCAILLGSLILANALKQLVPFLKRSLMPASVLGGAMLLTASTICKFITGEYLFNLPAFSSDSTITGLNELEIITYHCLAIGFIAMSLRQNKKSFSRKRLSEIFDTGVTTVSTYLIQAVLGILVTICLATVVPKLLKSSGIILALGYGQGTGQALNYGSIYESLHGFSGGKSFGLTIAALGFLSASIFGVIYLNYLRKKGRISVASDETASAIKSTDIQSEDEIPMTSTVDKFSIQVGFIVCAYAVAYIFMYLLSRIVGEGMTATIFGFNFLLGTIVAVGFKAIYNHLRKKKVIKREYINNFMLSRISGFAFDVMIVAGIAAIQIDLIAEYWYTLVILGLVGAFSTFVYIKYVCARIFPHYKDQQFLAMFGMLTGTASTGMILLREVDPEFSSPVSENLVYQNLPAIIFGFPIMLFVSYAPTSDFATYLTVACLAVLCVLMNIILFRRYIFRKNKNK